MLWKFRELIGFLTVSELKVQYKNKILGFLWTILDPLIMMGIYIIIVSVIFKRGGPQFPVLLFSALLAWKWFTTSLGDSVVSVSGKARLLQSVYFPKIVLPLSKVVVATIEYFLSLIVLFPLLILFKTDTGMTILWLPVLITVQLVLTIGLSLICACLGVYFRDFQQILQYILRIMFYLSPVLYSVKDRVPKTFRQIYMLNPFAALFESYKNIFVRGSMPSEYVLLAAALAVVALVYGLWIFNKKEFELLKYI